MTIDPSKLFRDHHVFETLASPKWNSAVKKRLQAYRDATARNRAAFAKLAAKRAHKTLWNARGDRYRRCTLANFQVDPGSKQEAVLKRIAQFADNLDDEIRQGTNLLLTGNPGTGKDHLVAALMTLAMAKGHIVKWTSGAMLFARLRDAIADDENERWLKTLYTHPTVLAISDPAWERKPLTRHQGDRLGDIVDARYNHLRPTWITLNAQDREEADELLGKSLVDRLQHGAVSITCDWPSFRKTRKETR